MSTRIPAGALGTLAALVAGIAVGEAAGAGSANVAFAGAVGGLLLALCPRARTVRVGVGVLACALLGTAVMQRALHGLEASPLRTAVAQRSDAKVHGTLVHDPDASRFGAEALVRVDSLSEPGEGRRTGGGRHVLVRATGDVAARLRLLAAGDGVVVRGWFEPLTGFDTRWRWKHAVGALHATDFVSASHPRGPLARVANTARDLVLGGSEQMTPVDRALLAGLLLGDTRGVPEELKAKFRDAGLTHLLAVSGENVAFVLALFAPVLRRLGLRGRLTGGVAVLLLFGTMTRWEPSVLRAITMAVIGLIAGYLGRPAAGLRVLVLAATVLLVADPFLIHSVGFLLSCGASCGIAVLARPIADRLRGPSWLREVLGVTAGAQLGVAPVLIPVFGSMPLVALPANLLAVPLTAPLTVWGLVAGVLGGAIRPYAEAGPHLLELPTVALLHALIAIADVAARVPIVVDGRAAWGVVALVALGAAMHRLGRLRVSVRLPVPTR
ncbi:MAG: ComEC/Rec2 family competence protein [Acidimicrobiia bacterium]